MGHAVPSLSPASTSPPPGALLYTAPPPAPSAPPRVSTSRLPRTSHDLFGRAHELAWLDQCWNERVHVASIVAWGGAGKSALVNRWLADLGIAGWRGAERVFAWSFYSQGTDRLSSADAFVEAALGWFGVVCPSAASPWDKGVRLAEGVRERRTILVLDGVEPLQAGPGDEPGKLKDAAVRALVKELAAENAGLCLLTSRIDVADLAAWRGDQVQEHRLDRLSAEAGAELLAARGARGSDGELRAAADEYAGHGLALALLGSYVKEAYGGDVRKRDLIPPLEGKPAQRMMATYEAWFAGKPELAILFLLGLFDRPAPEDEIAALRAPPVVKGLTEAIAGLAAPAWNRAVERLRSVGLVEREGPEGAVRLDAHPLVREYFGERLRKEQEEAWREGNRRLYVFLTGKAEERPDTLAGMEPLYAAVVHGVRAGKSREAYDEVWRKRIRRGNEGFSIHKLGAFGSEVAVLAAFFDPPWEQLAPGLTEPAQAIVLGSAGFALRALGRLPEAAQLLEKALERHLAAEDWKEAAIDASNLSELLLVRGALDGALARARESIALADRSRDAFSRMVRTTKVAAVLHAMGCLEDAAAQFEEAERMQEEMQPEYPRLCSLPGFLYCDILLDRGGEADVRERAEQARKIAERNHWLLDIALDHLSLGRAHLLGARHGTGGDLAQAASHLASAVDGLRSAGRQDYLPLGLLARAAVHTHDRAFPRARADLREALDLAERCGLRLHACDAHLGHARLALAEGDPAAARGHLAKARALVEETGYHRRDRELADLDREAGDEPP